MCRKLSVVALLSMVAVNTEVNAEIIAFEVIPAFAPVHNSASWDPYVVNAVNTLINIPGANISSRGAPGYNPASYESVDAGLVDPREAMVTPFPSWRGFADDTPGWDGPNGEFAGEQGNRIHFGVRIVSGAESEISLADISWEKEWLNADDLTESVVVQNPTTSGDFSASEYSATKVGADFGADGVLGGGDDTLITSGPASQPVDAIYYVGIGDGLYASNPDSATDQLDIDYTIIDFTNLAGNLNLPLPQQKLQVTYTLAGHDVEPATGMVVFVPEPSSVYLALSVLILFVPRLRRS